MEVDASSSSSSTTTTTATAAKSNTKAVVDDEMYCFVNHQKNLKFLKIDYKDGLRWVEYHGEDGYIIEVKEDDKAEGYVNIETVLEMFIKDNGNKGRKGGRENEI